ncbi:uncharacterized protein LAESUDRAFT_724708 [Laetiporus sulphureus 93-53]|uniref:Uncharacterized protein n=1 Tax=Laetiporus sulphureus 93-53 TaxID=1314785 RepID=A0A165ETA0_9APHY|nr:uncharacterized protein LAESUDRAFT_724708 [Laetiporus sulphureus 93-53]KZT07712.1 hypothetical protein LAESUDRAFT_724708 [Laetiporus sulphureus 93-53]
MGGSSGSNSDDSSDDDSDVTDDGLQQSRGRPLAKKAAGNSKKIKGAAGNADKAAGAQPPPRRTGSARRGESPVHLHQRRTFTRSRSPALNAANGFHFGTSIHPPRPSSPSLFSKPSPTEIRNLFPSFLHLTVRVPFSPARWRVTLDLRQAAENSILICSAGYAAAKMCACAREPLSPDLWNARDRLSPEMWISIGACRVVLRGSNTRC